MTTVAALTLATGGSVLDAIKSAAFAFVQMEAFSQVGAYLREVGLASNFLAKGLVHGVVGGAMSMAQGGGFVQGFAGSAIGAAGGLLASGSGSPFGTYGDGITELALARAAVSAAAGCAAAAVTGGKCAQAAVTAAFANIYNRWGSSYWSDVQQGTVAWFESVVKSTFNFYSSLLPGYGAVECLAEGCGAGGWAMAAAGMAPAGKLVPKPFAMGLEGTLDSFADARKASTWKNFEDPSNWKVGVLDKLADPNTTVHFNLDSVDVWRGVSRASAGVGGATDWELLMIRQNPQWWNSIQFWKSGQPAANPFAK